MDLPHSHSKERRLPRNFDPRVTWGDRIPQDAPVDGPNERCIELPLALEVMQLQRPGRVLDAGCAVNGHLPAEVHADVMHLTQNISSENTYEHKVTPLSYVSADLRDLSMFAGAAFDRTVCVSTLEHVGLDNSGYKGPEEACPDTMPKAVKELCRVTRSELLITVPYAEPPWHCSKWRYLGNQHLRAMKFLIEQFGFQVELRYYAKTDGGWYGGETSPVDASPAGFPQIVNAIVCFRCTQ